MATKNNTNTSKSTNEVLDVLQYKYTLMREDMDRANDKISNNTKELNDRIKLLEQMVIQNFYILLVVISVITVFAIIGFFRMAKALADTEQIIVPTAISMVIDGENTTLYISEDNKLYSDEHLTIEFPNDNEEPWIYSGDKTNPFLTPYIE